MSCIYIYIQYIYIYIHIILYITLSCAESCASAKDLPNLVMTNIAMEKMAQSKSFFSQKMVLFQFAMSQSLPEVYYINPMKTPFNHH